MDEANLRCDIVWCPTKCCSSGLPKHIFFAHAKVCYLYVSVLVQHHIVQLQISEERHKTICNQFHYSMVCLKYCSLKINIRDSVPVYSVAVTV